jgi:hypothetical protein
LHVIDRQGRSAAHTGKACLGWSGSIAASGVSVAGNMLARPKVLDDTLAAYLGALDRDFEERLIIAMEAGEKAGGDRRGRQSCALKIWCEAPFPRLDLRIDDHPEPLAELAGSGASPMRATCRSRASFRPDPIPWDAWTGTLPIAHAPSTRRTGARGILRKNKHPDRHRRAR